MSIDKWIHEDPQTEEEKKLREKPPIKATEIDNLESDEVKKLIELYEKETNKYAIWRGSVTEGFKNWLKSEIAYDYLGSFKGIRPAKEIKKLKDSV